MKKCACSGCHDGQGSLSANTAASCCAVKEADSHSHGEHCGHDHGEADGCGCGHSHGEGQITTLRQDMICVTASAAAIIAGQMIAQPTVKIVFMAAAILIAGLPVFWQGIKNILKLSMDELALLTVAVIAAVCIGELFEAALVTLLFRLGEILEELAIARSRREVEAVTKIIPEEATLLLPDGLTQVVPAGSLPVGSLIMIKSGESLPVDCVVQSGRSSVDNSSLTGESLPREVGPGDALLSSAINLGGALICETTSTFRDSAAAKIIEMVRESAAKKGKAEKLISRFARVYTPIVMILAVLTATVPPLLNFGSFQTWIYRALVFLVASCPCALVIATPLVFFAGIGAASKQGILVKGSRYVEALAKTGAVVFDKTGTLTTGKPRVTDIIPAPGQDRDEMLHLAALCEGASTHPIAQAIAAALPVSLNYSQVERWEEVTARGMRALIDGKEILCGSARMMEENSVDISQFPPSPLYVAKDGTALGAIQIADRPRDDARESIERLRAMSITRTAMLTGDAQTPAREVQALTGVGEVHHSLLPADKVDHFEQIKAEAAGTCLFVGDGINDSPVLARADAGIAMGLASDAAMQAADVVLLTDRLCSLPQAIRIARATSRMAKGIIAFALSVKLIVLLLAFFGYAEMWLAVFADVGVSILSVIAATFALRFK